MHNVHVMQPTLTKFDPPSQSFVSLCVGDVGVLVGLGLSVRQACVYLALLRAGVAKGWFLICHVCIGRRCIGCLMGCSRWCLFKGVLVVMQRLV